MSAVFIAADAALSIPAVLAGFAAGPLGLDSTFEILGSAVAALALVVAVQAWRSCPRPVANTARLATEAAYAWSARRLPSCARNPENPGFAIRYRGQTGDHRPVQTDLAAKPMTVGRPAICLHLSSHQVMMTMAGRDLLFLSPGYPRDVESQTSFARKPRRVAHVLPRAPARPPKAGMIPSLPARYSARQRPQASLPSIAIVRWRLLRTHLLGDCERAGTARSLARPG